MKHVNRREVFGLVWTQMKVPCLMYEDGRRVTLGVIFSRRASPDLYIRLRCRNAIFPDELAVARYRVGRVFAAPYFTPPRPVQLAV